MKKSLQNQKISTSKGVSILDTILAEERTVAPMDDTKKVNVFTATVMASISLIFGMLFMASLRACDKDPEPVAVQKECSSCHNRQMAMSLYFKARKNPYPDAMAEAVLKTKTPKLLASIAVVGEKNTPYTVRNGGYKKVHAGAWQVNPAYWGKVPHTINGQAEQVEDILFDLTDDKPIKEALSIYGGDSTDAYQERVLREIRNVP